ncbi:hypothetical protein ACFL55_03065 [Candidatus Latescibacterota bacterium]
MDKKVRMSLTITLVLGIITFLWLVYDLYQVNQNLPAVLDFAVIGYIMGIGYLFILLFHFTSLFVILLHSFLAKELRTLKIAAFTLAILSFFAIGGEKVMFDEIAREATLGWETAAGEFMILNMCFFINMLFTVVMVLFLLRALSQTSITAVTHAEKEEIIFTIAQYLGIVSGVWGILITLSLVRNQIPLGRLWIYLPFYGMILTPYALAVAFWFSLKLKTKITDWYDEKQWRDMLTSSFTTLVLSIPGLAGFFLIGQSDSYYWFPYYLFLVLLLFSTGTLYFYRRG